MRRWVARLSRFGYLTLSLSVCFLGAASARAQDAMALPQGRVGTPYSTEIKTEGGLAPLMWRLSGGQLPPGLNVSPGGRIEGTPTGAASEPFTFEMTLSDSSHPPQIVTQRFSILISAPTLRIVGTASVTGTEPLKIIGPSKPVTAEQGHAARLEPQNMVAAPISYIPPREPHFVVALLQAPAADAAPKPDNSRPPGGANNEDKGKTADNLGPLDPANFTWVYEDPKTGDRRPIYCPPKKPQKDTDPKTDTKPVKYCPAEATQKQPIQLVADYESSILITPDGNLMGGDVAFNKLFITAKLTSGDSSKDVAVNGYSEIGKDQATMAAQSGTAFQSAANIQAMVLNMAYVASDLVESVYPLPKPDKSCPSVDPNVQIGLATWICSHPEIDFRSPDAQTVTDNITAAVSSKDSNAHDIGALTARLRLYQPEIQAISNFLVQKENLELVEKLGVKIFWIDRDSMVAIAQQYKDDIQTAFDPKGTSDAQLHALQDLLERTKLVYEDFGDIRQEIKTTDMKKYDGAHTDFEWKKFYEKALQDYAVRKRKEAATELKRLLATGSISLTENQAKDGDRLTITVQSVPSGSTNGGIPVVFEVAVKKFGAKVQLSPSFLFVRRLGVTDAEAAPPLGSTTAPLNRVNFAPSPGMTFGVAYFHRGSTAWDKFVRGLGPGAGINVTFMNFNDPGYNLVTNQFTNTNGTNVQVGAGLIGSLFDDKIQFSYGWDLNVERRRTYFGIGFGFIEIGKELAKYIPK